MKKYIILLSLCCGLCAAAQLNRAQQIREKLLKGDDSSVIVASHRGDWRNFSENSLEGLEGAIAMGVDIVEADLQMTKDSVLILMHDGKLDRTTTGKGKVSEVSIDSVRKVNLKNGCAIRTQQKVPTLEEYLLCAKGRIMINLDKADRYFPQVMELAKKTGTTDQIIMKGNKSYEEVKELFGPYIDEVIYMPIVKLDEPNAEQEIESFIADMHPVAFELLFVSDSNPLPLKLAKTMKGRSLIWYNTLWDTMAGGHDDDMSLRSLDEGYGYLIDTLGARMIQTDRPARLIEYLRGRGLHD
ncbi:MAG: glycerophosphodiester phosphodiesterase family protein [Clostridium sp.]|nr:glycerophosphodiester phosphodiesterase family protein [Clostridium sp.]